MARFLVLDDEENTVAALHELLKLEGHDVAAFSSSRDALDALADAAFDVVLTDLEMPHVRGERVVQVAREHHPTACIFVMTARRNARGLSHACHVLEKPFDYLWLSQLVSECPARGSEPGPCKLKPEVPRS
jgi:DNA-binding NtrC family response regulator